MIFFKNVNICFHDPLLVRSAMANPSSVAENKSLCQK
jgi:hypothetical protein